MDKLDKEVQDNSDILTEEMRAEFMEVLKEYAPQAKRYVLSVPRAELVDTFVNWVLTMRLVEFKADKSLGLVRELTEIMENRNYSKSTRESILSGLQEVGKWLRLI